MENTRSLAQLVHSGNHGMRSAGTHCTTTGTNPTRSTNVIALAANSFIATVPDFRQNVSLEDAIGSHTHSLEALAYV